MICVHHCAIAIYGAKFSGYAVIRRDGYVERQGQVGAVLPNCHVEQRAFSSPECLLRQSDSAVVTKYLVDESDINYRPARYEIVSIQLSSQLVSSHAFYGSSKRVGATLNVHASRLYAEP